MTRLLHVCHDCPHSIHKRQNSAYSPYSSVTPSLMTWLIHVGHDSFIRAIISHKADTNKRDRRTCRIVAWQLHVRHDSFICDVTPSCVPSLATKQSHTRDIKAVTYERHRRVLLMSPWLLHMWHDSFICDTTHSHSRICAVTSYQTDRNSRDRPHRACHW